MNTCTYMLVQHTHSYKYNVSNVGEYASNGFCKPVIFVRSKLTLKHKNIKTQKWC